MAKKPTKPQKPTTPAPKAKAPPPPAKAPGRKGQKPRFEEPVDDDDDDAGNVGEGDDYDDADEPDDDDGDDGDEEPDEEEDDDESEEDEEPDEEESEADEEDDASDAGTDDVGDDDEEADEDDEDSSGDVMEMDLDEYGGDEDLEGAAIPPGYWHVEVDACEVTPAEGDKNGFVALELRILAGETDDGSSAKRWLNKVQRERVYLTESTKDRIARFARYLGVIKPTDLGKRGVKLDWNRAVGRHAVVHTGSREYNGRIQSQVDFLGIWDIADLKVAHVPLNKEAIEEAGLRFPKRKKRPSDETT